MTAPSLVIEVDSDDLARVAHNALAFLPAVSRVKVAQLKAGPGLLSICSTDTWTVGVDTLRPRGRQLQPVIESNITREGLQALEAAARADKKAQGRIEIFPLDSCRFTDSRGQVTSAELTSDDALPAEFHWEMVEELLFRLDQGAPLLPRRVAFDPKLLARFAKVKCDKAERVADLLITDDESPVLVKIGPTFVGAIMPIHRETHVETVGDDEGLWDSVA